MPTHAGVVASAYVLFDSFIFAGGDASPYVYMKAFQNGTLQTQYSNPATLPTGAVKSLDVNAAQNVIVLAETLTPFVEAYVVSPNGFGTKYSNPATLPTGIAEGAGWRGSSDIAIGHQISPFVTVYAWSSGFGTKYANPAVLPGSTVLDVTFNPAQNVIACGENTSNHFSAWIWSAGFSTKLTTTNTISTSAQMVSFTPDGTVIATITGSVNPTPNIFAWAWSNTTGIGTKYADSTNTLGDGYAIRFHPSGNAVVAGFRAVSPYYSGYAWSNVTGWGTKYTDPAALMTGVLNVSFNTAGTYIAISGSGVRVLPFNTSTGWGTALTGSITTGNSPFGLKFI